MKRLLLTESLLCGIGVFYIVKLFYVRNSEQVFILIEKIHNK